MRTMNMSRRHQQKGFGMVEVLVAMLVLAIGVLGFAALQVRAITATGESYYRSQAMSIAQDVAERAQANRAQARAGAYVVQASWNVVAPTTPSVACNNAVCTAAQMTAYDINQSLYVAATQLPAGRVNMQQCQGSQATCIYVSWDGTLPTAGALGQCVNAAGTYVAGANCIRMPVN
jgi:type IV pilus assembly protein PilV